MSIRCILTRVGKSGSLNAKLIVNSISVVQLSCAIHIGKERADTFSKLQGNNAKRHNDLSMQIYASWRDVPIDFFSLSFHIFWQCVSFK